MDEELVRTLLSEQYPDLADLPLKEVIGGWGNQMWRLGDDLAVRLPRHAGAPQVLHREHRWLPDLSARLPMPIPVPRYLGAPSDRFPRTWLVTTWVHGEPADHAPISDPAAAWIAHSPARRPGPRCAARAGTRPVRRPPPDR